jgi:CheY-like chemotaxis protein
VPSNRSLLIVEDSEEWRDIYARMAAREDFSMVKEATNLAEAVELIDQIRFSFAFIDIGLDTVDDHNVDGMRVLQRIRSLGDETSLIVVTGRSGRDVLPLTRDAIMKYHVQDIVGKNEVVPQDIREAIRRGVEAFTAAVADQLERRCAQGLKVLHNLISNGPSQFDGTSQPGIPEGLARHLLAEWLPILPEKQPSNLDKTSPPGLTHAICWSRAIGQPIAIALASAADLDKAINTASSAGILLGGYPVGELLEQVSWNDRGGAVFALAGAHRDSFGFSEGAPE